MILGDLLDAESKPNIG